MSISIDEYEIVAMSQEKSGGGPTDAPGGSRNDRQRTLGVYHSGCPPVTRISCPVKKDESLPRTKAHASTTSGARTGRCRGVSAWGEVRSRSKTETTFAVTLKAAASSATTRQRPSIPASRLASRVRSAAPVLATREETNAILPNRRSIMDGNR